MKTVIRQYVSTEKRVCVMFEQMAQGASKIQLTIMSTVSNTYHKIHVRTRHAFALSIMNAIANWIYYITAFETTLNQPTRHVMSD